MVFLEDYFSLLKIRFENAIQLQNNVPAYVYDKFLVPPISLQVLIENAVKHNEFSDAKPLLIDIEFKNEELIISNSINKKNLRHPSSKIGLQNLDERYKLTTQKGITINDNNKEFKVILPLLKIE